MKRLPIFIAVLSILIFIWACSGGGGGEATPTMPGASGQICVTSETQYTITDGVTGESQTITFETDSFMSKYKYNIGGQIRAVTSALMSVEDQEPITTLMWALGSSIQYVTAGKALGPLILTNEGLVTDMVTYGSAESPKIFFGTQRGIGIAEIVSDTTRAADLPPYKMNEVSFKTIPPGVISVAVLKEESKTSLFFVTGDGYVLTVDESELVAGSGCYNILSSKTVLTEGSTQYLPVKIAAATGKALVLAKKTYEGLIPTFSEAYDPVLQTLITGEPQSIVRAVDLASHGLETVAFESQTKGFRGFNQFIPTDVSSDGTIFYVAGLGYDKSSVDSFLIAECDKPSTEEKLACMEENAKDGDLIFLDTDAGVDALTGGFFIYRDLATIAQKAAHFARVPLSVTPNNKLAPPLIFHVAVNGDKAVFRAPNFLVAPTKSTSGTTGEEDWTIGAAYDETYGLIPAIPANLNTYTSRGNTYFVGTSVGIKAEDGSGASSVEILGSDGVLTILDTGALKTRMEDAKRPYLAEIDQIFERGGVLYLENPNERYFVLASDAIDAYTGRAAYNGSYIAFAWSKPAEGWRIDIQQGLDISTKGELMVPRDGDSHHYVGFPAVAPADVTAYENARDILDMTFAEGKLFILYYGYAEGKHYYQAGVYSATLTDGKNVATLQGITNTISFNGAEIDRHGRFQKITKSGGQYTVIFSCAGGLRQFLITPASPPSSVNVTTLFSAPNVIDMDFDDTGARLAYVSGKTIFIKSTSDYAHNISSTSFPDADVTSTRLTNAAIVLTSKSIFLATPVGASAPFWIFDITTPATPTMTTKCKSCHFNGLATFKDFPDWLFVSSETGGVEIYDITGL